MIFKDFSKLVLQHLDQYSVAGEQIPVTYNNQADYTERICALANVALRTISTQAAPLTAILNPNLDNVKKESMPNGFTKITMPNDFWKMTGQGIPTFDDDVDYARNMHYQFFAPNQIVVRTKDLPKIQILYHRYPTQLHGQSDEILDGTEMMADCASFYVAAQLARHDSPYAYQSLYNEFETMMARLKPPIIAEYSEVEDVYQFF